MNSNSPAFVPAFYASSYGDEHDDEYEFSAEHIVAATTAAADTAAALSSASFVSDAAAAAYASASASDDEDDDNALFVPKTTYRDTNHVFANGPCDLVFHSESFLESSFLSLPGKAPVFVLESASTKLPPITTASPLSPSSYATQIDIPQKATFGFHCVNPVMPSRAAPTAIMTALQAALSRFDCDIDIVGHWTIHATLLCVAEEIGMTIELSRVDAEQIDVDFHRRAGDETMFNEVVEHIRSLCADVDADALPLLYADEPLSQMLDASQELVGRQFAIKEKDARLLIDELTADDAHSDSMLHVARAVKNHCRHRGNRKLFVQTDCSGFLEGLRNMLTASDDVVRFGVFVLAQFARARDGERPFFATPFDKSAFQVLLDDVVRRHCDMPGGRFTVAMVEQVQQSWVFC